MKATELRIGNFVTYNWSEEQPERPFVIRGIIESDRKEGVPEYNIHIGDGRVALPLTILDLIFPIKITEEWLNKLGFEKIEYENSEPRYEKEYKSIKYYSYNETFQWQSNDGFDEVQLEFVHELQNLYYAHFGEELVLAVTPINTKTNGA